MKVRHVPLDADDVAIQEALIKLFNAQVKDQTESVVVEGQASRQGDQIQIQIRPSRHQIQFQISSV